MILCYGEACRNISLALRIYRARFPYARHPVDSRRISSAHQRLPNNQPIDPVQESAGRSINVNAEECILDVMWRNPRLDTRTASRGYGG